ncbi:MAG: hypothetical protein ACRCWO_08570 [Bosea sp. (in: a-proteobacteria)]
MNGIDQTGQREARERSIDDLRRKFRRAGVAMSFLPATELARHMGLGDSGIADRLIGDRRLSQRIYWSLVDAEKVPDLSALPASGALQLLDSPEAFENACLCIDGALALRDTGPILPREDIKELAKRFGDDRLKWLWANRDIWASDTPARDDVDATRRKPDSRRLLVNHLAARVPEVAAWMGRDTSHATARNTGGQDGELVARLVDRLVHGDLTSSGGAGNHVN